MVKKVQYTSKGSLKDILDELRRIGGPPGFKVVGGLETALAAAFADTQARTHVITGSLKASGTTDSDFDGDVWSGSITYGGASPGPNNPVDYAIYEMARGGDHDFFAGMHVYDGAFEEAINKHFTD